MSDIHSNSAKEPILELRSVNFLQNIKLAITDLVQGLLKIRLAWVLGVLDIKLKYRGSVLGPFWITIVMTIKITTIGVLYGFLFKIKLTDFLPYISISIILWIYMNNVIIESCMIFQNSSRLVLSTRLPYSIYAWRTVFSNFLIFLHNTPIVIIVFIIFKTVPHAPHLLFLGFGLWIINTVAICLLLGLLGTRFKDIPPIIGSIMQALFFITPVIWKPSLLTFNKDYLLLNPLYPFFDIIRSPILGETVDTNIWMAAIGYSIVLWIMTLLIFSKARFRITYWM